VTRPAAMDGLETGISKRLRDELAEGGKVIVESSDGIAGTVVDYLTWPKVQPLLRRFVTELAGETDAYEAGFTAGAAHAVAQLTNDVAEILDLGLPGEVG
jgi:hypothetical protein